MLSAGNIQTKLLFKSSSLTLFIHHTIKHFASCKVYFVLFEQRSSPSPISALSIFLFDIPFTPAV